MFSFYSEGIRVHWIRVLCACLPGTLLCNVEYDGKNSSTLCKHTRIDVAVFQVEKLHCSVAFGDSLESHSMVGWCVRHLSDVRDDSGRRRATIPERTDLALFSLHILYHLYSSTSKIYRLSYVSSNNKKQSHTRRNYDYKICWSILQNVCVADFVGLILVNLIMRSYILLESSVAKY